MNICYRDILYNSDMGKFISKDPIGFSGGDENLYRYVGNSPIFNSDPFGLLTPPSLIPNPLYFPIPKEILPKSSKSDHPPSLLEKATYLYIEGDKIDKNIKQLENVPSSTKKIKSLEKIKQKLFNEFIDNVFDNKNNRFNDLNCPQS